MVVTEYWKLLSVVQIKHSNTVVGKYTTPRTRSFDKVGVELVLSWIVLKFVVGGHFVVGDN